MAGLIKERGQWSDVRYLECLDTFFRPGVRHDWRGIVDTANPGSEAWVSRIGGLYIGYLVLAKESALAYPTDSFVNPRFATIEDEDTAKLLLERATDVLLKKEGVVVMPTPPEMPASLEVPRLATVTAIRG